MSTGTATPETQATEAPAVEAPKTPPKNKAEIYSRIAEKLNNRVNERFEPVQKRVKDRHKEEIHMRRVFGDDEGRGVVVDVFSELIALLTNPVTPSDPNDPNSPKILVKGTTVGLPAGLGSFELLTAGATKKKTPQGEIIDVKERWRMKWNPGKAVDDILAGLPEPIPSEPKEKAPKTDAPSTPAPAEAAPPAAPTA